MSELLHKQPNEEKQEANENSEKQDDKKKEDEPSILATIVEEINNQDNDNKKSSNVSNADKLEAVRTLTGTLNELRVEPQFALPWLLTYLNGLQAHEADEATTAAFSKWAWAAFSEPSAAHADLSGVPAPVMVRFAHDIAAKANDQDLQKVLVFS